MAAIWRAVIGASVIVGIASVSIKAVADSCTYRALAEPIAPAGAAAMLSAAAAAIAMTVLRIEVSPFLGSRPFKINSSNRRLVAWRAFR
jgi:hypothetical protein